jgi:hypothetical protein
LTFRVSVLSCLALAPSAAFGQVITQVVPFDYSPNDGVTFPVLQGFDTLGGMRRLDRVSFEFRHNFALEVFVESTGPDPVNAADFTLAISYNTLFQVGEGKSPPFFGPGGLNIDDATGDLGAFDGVPGNDGPDSYRRSFTDAFTAIQEYTDADPDVLAAVTGAGQIPTVFGGFGEIFFAFNNDPGWPTPPGGVHEYPTDAWVWVGTPTFRHFGEIEVRYEFTQVPTPAGAGVLGAGALGLTLRRRRR